MRVDTLEEEELSKRFIESLQQEEEAEEKERRVKLEEADQANCDICLCDLYEEEFKPLELCGHVYHVDCMKNYL